MKIVCTKEYDCRDPVLGLSWAPGAVLDLPDKVAKKIVELSPHSFKEFKEEKISKTKDEEVK